MQTNGEQKEAIRQYLLGQMSQEGLTELEERLLADGEFYEELLIEEDELVDQYLRGELSVPESEYFESHFLRTAERQQKLSFAAALKKYIAFGVAGKEQDEVALVDLAGSDVEVPEPPPRWPVFYKLHIHNPAVGFALAAAVLVILFGSVWIIVRNSSQPEPHDILTEVLTPGLTRGEDHAEVRTFSIPPGKDTVRLQLVLVAADYQAYRTVLLDATGTVILQKDSLKSQLVGGRPAIILDIPAAKLPASDYQIKLRGITAGGNDENAGSYHFAVSK